MHKIDGPNAGPGGVWIEGDPVTGTPSTIVTDDFMNAIQDEVCNVITGSGASLSKPDNTQLLTAIRTLIDLALPVGTVVFGFFVTAKPGFVLPQGQLLSRSSYARLWAYAQAEGLVVSDASWSGGQSGVFSSGDGSTNFRLPKIGGQFLRITDMGAGVDSGRTVGSLQAQMLAAHKHLVPWGEAAGGQVSDGAFGRTASAGKFGSNSVDVDNYWFNTNDGSAYDGSAPGNAAGLIGTETRPKNVAFGAMLRY